MCGGDCWPVSESVRENILASDSSSESPRPPWWFSWLVKSRADFGSAQHIQFFHGFFARTELLALAGVDSLVLVSRKWDRDKTRSSSVAVVVPDFCSLPVRAHRCQTDFLSISSLEVGFLPFLGPSTYIQPIHDIHDKDIKANKLVGSCTNKIQKTKRQLIDKSNSYKI